MIATKDGQVGLIEQRVTQLEQKDSYSRDGCISGTLFHCLILLHMIVLLLHIKKIYTQNDRLHMKNMSLACSEFNKVSLVCSQPLSHSCKCYS